MGFFGKGLVGCVYRVQASGLVGQDFPWNMTPIRGILTGNIDGLLSFRLRGVEPQTRAGVNGQREGGSESSKP